MQRAYKGTIQFWISFVKVIVTSCTFFFPPENFWDCSTSYIKMMRPILLRGGGSYEAVLSLNWERFWLRANRNIIGSLFKGWAMFCLLFFCKKVEVSEFLMGNLKSERIGSAYCEYGVKGGFWGSWSNNLELELCSIKVLWNLERFKSFCLK